MGAGTELRAWHGGSGCRAVVGQEYGRRLWRSGTGCTRRRRRWVFGGATVRTPCRRGTWRWSSSRGGGRAGERAGRCGTSAAASRGARPERRRPRVRRRGSSRRRGLPGMAACFRPKTRRANLGTAKRGRKGFVIRDTRGRRAGRRWGEAQVPKCGRVRFRWTRTLPADRAWPGSRWTGGPLARRVPGAKPARPPGGGGPAGIDRGGAPRWGPGGSIPGTRISGRRAAAVPGAAAPAAQAEQRVAATGEDAPGLAQLTDRSYRSAPRLGGEGLHPPGQRHDVIVGEKLNTPGMVPNPGEARRSIRVASSRTGRGLAPG